MVVVVIVVVVERASDCAGGSPSINLAAVVDEEVAYIELGALKIRIEIKIENLLSVKNCIRIFQRLIGCLQKHTNLRIFC